jgi:AcrR family transcriptional regulator
MSRIAPKASRKTSTRKPDRRVRRTRETLGDALVSLMHENPLEEITVQHILNRAEVSRSTFYTHFSDKNDLFLSDAEEFLEKVASLLSDNRDASRRLVPVRELFCHVAEWRPFFNAMVASGKIQDVMEIGQECFARAIARRLAELPANHAEGLNGRPLKSLSRPLATALSQMLAGSLMTLMSWWLNSGQSLSAAQMDDLYHEFAWAGIGGCVSRPVNE